MDKSEPQSAANVPKAVKPVPGVYVRLTGEGEVRVECVALNNPFVAIGLLELAKSILLKKMHTPPGKIAVPGRN